MLGLKFFDRIFAVLVLCCVNDLINAAIPTVFICGDLSFGLFSLHFMSSEDKDFFLLLFFIYYKAIKNTVKGLKTNIQYHCMFYADDSVAK